MELYHSDKYLGADYSNGIKHYKYIKREMKNGRYVYYYNTSELENQHKNIKDVINYDKNMIKNNKTYTNPQTGQKFSPDHYKKALKYDTIDLIKTGAKIKGIKTATQSLNEISKYRDIGKKQVNEIFDKLKNKRR